MRPRLVPVFVLLPLVWLALLVAAPALAFGVPLSGLTYALGSLICHQRPERSLELFGAQMPVCARCAGLYAGAATGALIAAVPTREWSPSARGWRTALVVAAAPTAGTWLAEVVGMGAPSNAVRAVAALPLGMAVAWLVIDTCRKTRTESSSRAA